jgi:aspartyl-tRNA(Asn)/glutamyl-tRNA(Gln) amidotransferase subunit C
MVHIEGLKFVLAVLMLERLQKYCNESKINADRQSVMKIDKKNIEYIANLSRLKLSESEKDTFVIQLSDILTYIEKLNKLNTNDVLPMSYPINATNVFREDKLGASVSKEDAFQNSPAQMDVFFKVPKVIE